MPCIVYSPTFTIKNQPNVGRYTIHGWYRYCHLNFCLSFVRWFRTFVCSPVSLWKNPPCLRWFLVFQMSGDDSQSTGFLKRIGAWSFRNHRMYCFFVTEGFMTIKSPFGRICLVPFFLLHRTCKCQKKKKTASQEVFG